MSGNRELVDYGIQTEESDYRVHVGFTCGVCYVFRTSAALEACGNGSFREVSAYQDGVEHETAKGLLVPPISIPGISQIWIPRDMRVLTPGSGADTSAKGRAAVAVVKGLLWRGLIYLDGRVEPTSVIESTEREDLAGADLIVERRIRIQVKCDSSAGPRAAGGSGNLFIQIAECNPLGME